jgi:predicted ATPase/DNA-binding winged helix-turn-helix (wHTH) protein
MPAGGLRPVYASGECEIDLARRELRIVGSPVPVGGRAFEILEILAESAGELVTKNELMDRVWPGAIVNDNTLQMHISAVRQALGPHRAVLKTERGRGYRLLGSWTVRDQGPATVVAPQQLRAIERTLATNIPPVVTRLIGRTTAVERLLDFVSAYRVVTLTGPGGIGKTALALEVVRELRGEFEEAARLVELASLSDPNLVPTAVASVLGLRFSGEEISAEGVARAVGDTNLLLILDTCEHVIDATANFVETVVRACPRTRILATSREILSASGEYVYRVPPLGVPAVDEEEPDKILAHGAVELFITRATALGLDLSPQAETLPAIGAICRRLDGIPLAIEFAATRAAVLGVQQVAAALHDRFTLLIRGRRTALPRHQTLRAALDWSYDLLAGPERAALRHLAIFAGPFDLAAAAALALGPELLSPDITETLSGLFAKSLVVTEFDGGAARYRLLDTIRAYGFERLAEAGERAPIAERHAKYYCDLFERAEGEAPTRPISEWLNDYGWQLDNLRAALDWSFSPDGSRDIGVALTAAAIPFWLHLSLLHECRTRVEHALAVLQFERHEDVHRELKMLTALAETSLLTKGPIDEIEVTWREALNLAEGLSDVEYQLRALWGLWAFHLSAGHFRSSLEAAQSFHHLATTQSDQEDVLTGGRMVGLSEHFLGDQASARENFERILANFSPSDQSPRYVRFVYDQRVVARANLGRVLWLQGYPDQAARTASAAVEEGRAANHAISLCHVLANTAFPIALWNGDLAAAERHVAILIEESAKSPSSVWERFAPLFEDVLRLRRGEVASGLRGLRAGLRGIALATLGAARGTFLCEMVEGLACAGHVAEAFAVAQEAIDRCERDDERWALAEFLRLKGELVLQQDEAAAATSDTFFEQAIDLARRQGALSWELRAATSLARLRVTHDRAEDARRVLAPVYERFTEGFDTADLKAAKGVLDSLR